MKTSMIAVVAVLVAASTAEPAVSAGEADVVRDWNSAALQAVRNTRMAPPVVARALAIVHTCMYDAWAAYDRAAVPTRVTAAARRPSGEHTPANKQAAISYAAYRSLSDLFPSEVALLFDPLMRRLGYDPADMIMNVTEPRGIGNVVARDGIDFRHQDGANQLGDLSPGSYSDYTGYRPANTPELLGDPNRWQPVPVYNGSRYVVPSFLAAHWWRVTPFALSAPDALRPPPPPAWPHGLYRAQANELLQLSRQLSDRQKAIAEYWSDGPASETPPGHWNLLAQRVSRRDHNTIDDDVRLFFALNNAMLDASIAAWDCKRYYDSVRPVSAIRFLFAGKPVLVWGGPHRGTQLIDGAQWMPYQPATFLTPPFPEYVSGHSTFSAAAAEILRSFTGSDNFGHATTVAAGSSQIEPGSTPKEPVTLKWQTFSEAADEAGMSRRYGGIHFESGDLAGRQLGRAVGKLVWHRALDLMTGRTAI